MISCPIKKHANAVSGVNHKTDCDGKNCGMYRMCYGQNQSYLDLSPDTHEPPLSDREASEWQK